ncbi:MAG: twin-arginine translocation signal domain-containing protein [Planctomycetes bacterium]|nr:twin-arginine translocation signal domain-containing protein [Planctomycetota bacterium]
MWRRISAEPRRRFLGGSAVISASLPFGSPGLPPRAGRRHRRLENCF